MPSWPNYESFVAQWLEHPTGVQKVIGSIPVVDSDFFFVPGLLVTCRSYHGLLAGVYCVYKLYYTDIGPSDQLSVIGQVT